MPRGVKRPKVQNTFGVYLDGRGVHIANCPNGVLTMKEALNLAAHLVLLAEPGLAHMSASLFQHALGSPGKPVRRRRTGRISPD